MKIKLPEKKLQDIYNSTVDYMLSSDMFSNNAYVYYPPTIEECPTCIGFNSFGCPDCSGGGRIEVEKKELVRLRIHFSGRLSFNKQNLKRIGINVEHPTGDVLTLGHLADLPKILACNYISFFESQDHQLYHYRLSGSPAPYGFGRSDYFYAIWERVK